MHITDSITRNRMNESSPAAEAEKRVRKLVHSIPGDHISVFIGVMEQNLKNCGSSLSVYDILQEEHNKVSI